MKLFDVHLYISQYCTLTVVHRLHDLPAHLILLKRSLLVLGTQLRYIYVHMELPIHSTLAIHVYWKYEGEKATYMQICIIHIAPLQSRKTWMPSLEYRGGGLKSLTTVTLPTHPSVPNQIHVYIYVGINLIRISSIDNIHGCLPTTCMYMCMYIYLHTYMYVHVL